MPGRLDPYGLRAIVEGYRQYQAQVAAMQASNAKLASSMKATATASATSAATISRGGTSMLRASAAATGYSTATLGLAGGFAVALKKGADFEVVMDKIQSILRPTEDQFRKIEEAVRETGKTTQFSATTAAEAVLELAKAGVSVTDIMGGALPGVLALATTGEMALADAATVAVQAMTVFGLKGEDITHVADVLSSTADKSVSSVASLAEGLSHVGPVASQLNIPLEDTVAFLAMLEQAGIKGSVAGNGLRRMLLELSAPTARQKEALKELGLSAFDASGKFIGLGAFSDQLKAKMSGLTPQARAAALAILFDAFAVNSASVAVDNGSAFLDQYGFKLEDTGSAARKMAVQTDNLSTDIKKLGARFVELGIALEQSLDPELRQTAQLLGEGLGVAAENANTSLLLVGTGIAYLYGGPFAALAVALIILAAKWDSVFAELPTAVQDAAIEVAVAIDAIVNAFLAGLQAMADAADSFGVDLGPVSFGGGDILGAAVGPAANIFKGIGGALGFGTDSRANFADTLRQIQLGQSFRRQNRPPGAFATQDTITPQQRVVEDLSELLAGIDSLGFLNEGGAGADEDIEEAVSAMQAFLVDIASKRAFAALKQQFGEAGAEAIQAFTQAIVKDDEASGQELATSIEKLIQTAKERGVENADEIGQDVITKIAQAMADGSEESFALARDAIVTLAIAAGTSAGDGFAQGMTEAFERNELEDRFGEAGADIMEAFNTALEEGTPESGEALAEAVDSLIDNARSAGVSDADDLGKALSAAIAAGIRDGTPEARAAIAALLRKIRDEIDAAEGTIRQVTYETLVEGVNDAIEAANLELAGGQAAVDMMRGLRDALLNNKPGAIAAVQSVTGGLIAEMYRNLSPATAKQLGDALMIALANAIATKGQAAIDAVIAVVNAINAALASAAAALDAALEPTIEVAGGAGGGGGPTAEEIAEAGERAAEEQRRKNLDAINRLGDAIIEALRRRYQAEYDLQRDAIDAQRRLLDSWADEQIKLRTGPLYAELEAMEELEDAQRLEDLQRRLRLAYDAKERAEIQKQIDAFYREERKEEILKEIDAIEDQVGQEKDAREDALDAQLDALDAYYDKVLSATALQNEARLLLEENHQEEIVALLEKFYPDWMEAGRSLAEQLTEGLKTGGIAEAVAEIIGLMGEAGDALVEAARKAGEAYAAASGGGGGGGGGGAAPKPKPPNAPAPKIPTPPAPPEPEGPAYSGVPASELEPGWNLVTTGTAGPSYGSDYGTNPVYMTDANGQLVQVQPGQIIPPGTPVWINQLAEGGIARKAALAMIGEGQYAEAVTPLSAAGLAPWADMFSRALSGVYERSGGPGEQIFNFDFRNTTWTGTMRENEDMLRRLVRTEMADQSVRGRRHWGVPR